MTVSDSITDFDVVLANLQIFQLLRGTEPEAAHDVLRRMSAAERDSVLAHRLASFRDKSLQVFRAIPPFADRAEDLADKWAQYRYERQTSVLQLLMYLQDARLQVRVAGWDRMQEACTSGRGPILIGLHMGPYQALVGALARIGLRVGCFMDKGALPLLDALYHQLVPRLRADIEPIGLPDPGATRQALSVIRSGRPLLVYPEFSLGDTRTPAPYVTRFFGREVHAPIGPARLARACRVPIVPVRFVQSGPAEVAVEFGASLYQPGSEACDEEVTWRIFSWLEHEVSQAPEAWWCWEVFEEMIAAPTSAVTAG